MSLTKFNPRVGAETIKTVDTIDDVKNSKDFSNPKLVLGGEILGDGDGGVYHWDSSSTRFADNVNVIKSAHKTMGRWLISSDTRLTGLIDIMGRIDTRVRALEEGPEVASYALSLIPDATSKEEGTSVTVRLTTTNGEYGTTLKYVVVGDIEEANEGIFDVLEVEQDLIFTISNDNILESGETITVNILDGLGNITHASITINVIDDSTYSLFKDVNDAVAGSQTFNVRLDVTEVPDGDYPFTLTTTNELNITPSTGVFTVSNGVGNSVEFSVPDVIIPAGATVTISLDDLNVSQTYDVADSALTSPDSFRVNIDTSLFDPANTSRRLDIGNASNVLINWGDGSPEEEITTTQSNTTHLYPSGGDDYTVYIKQVGNTSCSFRFGGDGNECVTEVLRWGTMRLSSMQFFMNGCSNLTTLPTIPESFDTSAVTGMHMAWYNCNKLLSFPSGLDTSAVTDIGGAWWLCRSLTSFPSGLDTSKVTDMALTWYACENLLSFPSGLDTSKVTNMYGTWSYCQSLTSFPSGLDTSEVTNMRVTWQNCHDLLSFPSGLDTSKVTNMYGTWYNCYRLQSFPAIDTSEVTNMHSTWGSCRGFHSFPFIDTSKVTDMGAAWSGCQNLISFPAIDTSEVTNMYRTWQGCINLQSFPSIDVSANTNFSGTWESCDSLSTFNPFINTTYTSAKWFDTWKDSDSLAFTSEAASPFANIGSNTIPVSDFAVGFEFRIRGLHDVLPSGSTYYPPFDISDVSEIYIDDLGTTITDFNLIGWDQMTFNNVEFGYDPNQTVEIDINATLANTEVDNILNQLYSNLSNHTQIQGTNTYSINFHSNVRTTASNTAINGLIAAGWDITLNNILQLGAGLQVGQDIDGESFIDWSGSSVSMNAAGTRVAIGAMRADGVNGTDSGHTRIYEYNDNNWVQLGQDIDGEAATDESGSSVSMNAEGNIVAIGAIHNDNVNGIESGHTRIYEYNGTNWVKLGQDIDEAGSYDHMSSVSMNAAGNRVAIGSPGNDATSNTNTNLGRTRIYEYNVGTQQWVPLGQEIYGKVVSDNSGSSVSMNAEGNIVAIGGYEAGNSYTGHTRIYEYDGNNWVQLGLDIDGEAAGDAIGDLSVSINAAGDRVAIGAPRNDGVNGADSGHTRIYEYNGINWIQLGSDIDGEAAADESGSSVSMNAAGDRVAIGARYNEGPNVSNSGSNNGHVRIFQI